MKKEMKKIKSLRKKNQHKFIRLAFYLKYGAKITVFQRLSNLELHFDNYWSHVNFIRNLKNAVFILKIFHNTLL